MSRSLEDWLTTYIEYTTYTESAAIFHKWVGISLIASALRRKVWFNFGRIKVHPNLFIVLVAEPGIARKTQAISYGDEILTELTGIVLSADATTPQALLEDLEGAANPATMPDNTVLTHCSLTISSGEFESFLGQKRDNTRMIVTLTDLFDCRMRPFRYRTKHAGSNTIPNPYLNLIAATTPEGVANSLPPSAIGGGLTSRIIFLWADDKEQKIDVPEETDLVVETKPLLIQDLSIISRITGGYDFTKESREWWKDYYMSYSEKDPDRICKDVSFNGWYSRKPMFIIKVGMIVAASAHSDRVVDSHDFKRSLLLVEEAEHAMSRTFSAVGRSEITADVDAVRNIVKQFKCISEHRLLQMVWRDMDAKKFDNVIATVIKSGEVIRKFRGPDNEKGIWYFWI